MTALSPETAASVVVARPRRPRGRLFLKYVSLFIAVVSAALVASGAFQMWFSYQEQTASLAAIQREQANAAAARIAQFVKEIEGQIGWTTQLPWTAATLEQQRFDAQRLLRQVPAITELVQVDGQGREQLRVSRLAMDVVGSRNDLSQDVRFTEAMAKKAYYGPVYFRRESEPYMTLAVAGARRDAGVSIAEVNLKFILEVVAQIKVGQDGHAYVVDRQGRLIAHPDISLVLRNTDMSHLAQVQTALANPTQLHNMTATDLGGNDVITAHAPITNLGWLVFVELPLAEAYAPVYASLSRTGWLLVLGLAIASVAGLLLARRMVVPIKALQAGAAELGVGELSRRIDVQTGDELEALANGFNDMAAKLQESYADLEQKVEQRTQELARTIQELRALGDVTQAVNSTLELRKVLDTIVSKAVELSGADAGAVWVFDEKTQEFHMETSWGSSPEFDAEVRNLSIGMSETAIGQAVERREAVQVPDLDATPPSEVRDVLMRGGYRALLVVPLLRPDGAFGALVVRRTEPGNYSRRAVELLQTFAGPSALAIQNARLFSGIEHANKAKSIFLANMSHELRTPMNAIIGFTRIVLRRGKELLPDKQIENLDKILVSANHLLALINDVLDLSKIEAGRLEVKPVDFALEPLLDQCMRTIEPLVNAANVQLVKEVEGTLPPLFNDQDKLRQIIINLLSNAAKFTEQGSITVHARNVDGAVAISVIDTGIGIPADSHEKVFDEFQQVDSSTTRKHGGTGLGLTISRRLARLMGGDLALASEAGRGSTFTVTVATRYSRDAAKAPAHSRAAPQEPKQAQKRDARTENAGGLVLAIDDDPDVVEMLRDNLSETGYRVVGARGGEEGIRLARELVPNAITLDILMPAMDGWRVLHTLKSDPRTARIPVVLLTVADQKDLGFRLGAADYLLKPFSREDLLTTLRRVAPRLSHVLLVDDDPNTSDLVGQWFEGEPCVIEKAADGVVALDAIRRRRPDVIVLDLLMPRMDGFGVIEAIERDPSLHGIPVVVLTAKTLTDEERRLLQERALAVIQKGAVDRDALMRKLREVLPQQAAE